MTARTLTATILAAGVLGGGTVLLTDDENCAVVDLDNTRHARVLANVWEAREAGHPTDLHIARAEADANRRLAVAGYPTVDGMDRDEYPPAMADEGGNGAHVAYAPSSENRSAGAVMGNQLERLPNGACFRFEDRP